MDIQNVTGDWIPKLLRTFLQVLVKSELKQNSIGQVIFQAAKPRRAIMLVPFSLEVELDEALPKRVLLQLHSRSQIQAVCHNDGRYDSS